MKSLSILTTLLALVAAPSFANEMLRCGNPSGGAKTNCTNNLAVSSSNEFVDFEINYTLNCNRIFTASSLVFSTQRPVQSSRTIYNIRPGTNVLRIPEAKSVYFGWGGTQNLTVSADCSLRVNSVNQFTSQSRLVQLKGEARRLTELLMARKELYEAVKDYSTLIDNYSIPKLRAMAGSLEQIFWDSVGLAHSEDDFNPFGQDSAIDSRLADLQDQGLEELGIVKRDGLEASYVISLDERLHDWYFEANYKFGFISGMLTEIANIKTAALMKEQAEQSGFEIPNEHLARENLLNLITEARAFLREIESLRSEMRSEFEKLTDTLTAVAER